MSSDSEKKKIFEKEVQLAQLKGYMNCELSIFSNKIDSFTASVKTGFTSFENCEKSNVKFLEDNNIYLQNEFLAKD